MTRTSSRTGAAAQKAPTMIDAVPGSAAMLAIARQVRGWADSVLSVAGSATDLAVAAAGAQTSDPKRRAAIQRAGAMLRRMRESAGLTVQDVSKALDLSNPELIESAEGGAVALPFEVILRLAAVVGRDDPVTAVMRLTRAYKPELWRSLERMGFGRLIVQAGRERELANIYRASDRARRLDDEEFARVLAFTRQAFEMAVEFGKPAPPAKGD